MSSGCHSPAQWKFAFHFLYHYQCIANREFAYAMLSSVNNSRFFNYCFLKVCLSLPISLQGLHVRYPESVKSGESLMLDSYILILLTVVASPAIPNQVCSVMSCSHPCGFALEDQLQRDKKSMDVGTLKFIFHGSSLCKRIQFSKLHKIEKHFHTFCGMQWLMPI